LHLLNAAVQQLDVTFLGLEVTVLGLVVTVLGLVVTVLELGLASELMPGAWVYIE
jgi:hypothetical protein